MHYVLYLRRIPSSFVSGFWILFQAMAGDRLGLSGGVFYIEKIVYTVNEMKWSEVK